ncbi:PspA/IM30 family protein [Candidatus Cyanaurora vandensis]|uniref:PspA/IM30 family protein n=1 Tax=Candidatus Cyanaurora vandensis TaxID=2714958 RepID=UPI00257A8DF6|nr:PspA/IM30 family protein [Candidatus Cyanaurora vandensis]
MVGSWNWLWGMPVEEGGKVAVSVAEESLRTMQESVQGLTQAVATQVAAYQRAQQKYQEKVKEYNLYESQAKTAQRNGNEDAARLAVSRLLQVEQVLPQLEEQVKQAEQFVTMAKEKLNRERMKLETYKTDLQNMKDMTEINEALAQMSKVNSDYSIDSARSQFEEAKNAVQRKNLKVAAFNELSENPAEKTEADLQRMTLDDEINRRLAQLEPPKALPPER